MKISKITNSSKEGTLKPYFEGWLKERFGDHFAQISVVTTLKLKNAVKDVHRAKDGYVSTHIEELVKRFEVAPQTVNDNRFIFGYTSDDGAIVQGSIERDKALQEYVKTYPEHWEIVKMCISLPRQRGRHASAFLVSNRPVHEFIPLTTVSGVRVTAFTGPEVESVGGLKMDWLVINSLNDIQNCLKNIKESTGHTGGYDEVLDPVSQKIVNVWDLPEDQAVFKDISQGNTESVFQFCTPSAKQWLAHFNFNRPDGTPAINSIAAMSAFTALDRPGPLDYFVTDPNNPETKHNMLVEYARRVRGMDRSKDIPEIVNRLCEKDYGIMIYQESLKRVYETITGCSGVEAEEFRINVGKKKIDKIEKAYPFFMERASKIVDPKTAQEVWDSLLCWGKYGFNMSHSTSYCIASYACAWLKHYYPLEWWCSVLTFADKEEIGEKFWGSVKDLVLLPDVSRSKMKWSIEDGKLRAPLSQLQGVGETAHKALVAKAPYNSVDDLCMAVINCKLETKTEEKAGKSPITIGTIYSLLASGALDSIFDPQKTINENIDLYQKRLAALSKEHGLKYNKTKTNYSNLDSLGRYMAKKDVIPIFGMDIRPILNHPDVTLDSDTYYYHYVDWNKSAFGEGKESVELVSGVTLQTYESQTEFGWGGITCAIVGYVEDCEVFSYAKKTKSAKKFFLETCGLRREMVKWPEENGEIPKSVLDIQKGSIVACVIRKYNHKGFSIQQINVLREPITKKEPKKAKESDE